MVARYLCKGGVHLFNPSGPECGWVNFTWPGGNAGASPPTRPHHVCSWAPPTQGSPHSRSPLSNPEWPYAPSNVTSSDVRRLCTACILYTFLIKFINFFLPPPFPVYFIVYPLSLCLPSIPFSQPTSQQWLSASVTPPPPPLSQIYLGSIYMWLVPSSSCCCSSKLKVNEFKSVVLFP